MLICGNYCIDLFFAGQCYFQSRLFTQSIKFNEYSTETTQAAASHYRVAEFEKANQQVPQFPASRASSSSVGSDFAC